ncbi:MAG: hypothetical protein ACOC8F_07450 [Planctomycetota bacterium]
MNDTPEDQPSIPAGSETPQSVTCPAAKDPAVRLFILAGMLIGFGIWCWTDLHNFPQPKVSFSEDVNGWAAYLFNHVGAYVLTPLGIIPLVWGFIFLRRRLVADGEGIGYVGREKLRWDEIDAVDAGKLQDKGILILRAGDRKLVLDSWKLRNFKALVDLVEQHTPAGATKAQ